MRPAPTSLPRDEARRFLVAHHHLARPSFPRGGAGVRAVLRALRCIQLDPLDVIGTNADLVVLARVDGVGRGDVHRHLYPGHAFEHFAKERCILPASAFPYYRDRAAETPWWRLGERVRRLPPRVIDEVLAEITARGPIAEGELRDHGGVEALDWSGWKGTGRATKMAIEVLWTRCQIVVCGRADRGGKGKTWDVPERALPDVARARPATDFARWALLQRVEAAGLLSRNAGAHWSMLSDVRTSGLPDALIAEGAIEEVTVEGAARRYLAPAGFRARATAEPDDRLRILAPLDPLLWDRALVANAFGFEYVWEVYKPAADRRWGWYVVPLMHRGQLVGRL
ncbi:MAG: winged helix DNA-binding domain-containing protein, partial [Polyangiales bacterium]